MHGEGNSGESAFAGKKLNLKCFGCGRYGHKKADCPCPDGRSGGRMDEPEKNHKFARPAVSRGGATGENEVAFVATTINSAFRTSAGLQRKIEWFLDSGATDHMLRDKSLFEELHPLARKVRIAVAKSGQVLVAEMAGTVRIVMLINGKPQRAVVNDVLFVPELQCNLFSVRRLEDSGMTVKIAAGKVSIQREDSVVCTGSRMGQ